MHKSGNTILHTTGSSNAAITPPDDGRLVSAEDAARIMGVHYFTLSNYRKDGNGPPFIKRPNRRILYRLADIEAWLADHTFG